MGEYSTVNLFVVSCNDKGAHAAAVAHIFAATKWILEHFIALS